MPIAVMASVTNPYWNTVAKQWFYDGAPDAGVTNGNAVAHPFAGSLGEQVIIFDGNNGNHQAKPYPVGLGATETLSGSTDFGFVTPDNTRRWGLRRAYLFRFTGTNTSSALIMQSRSITTGLFLNTDLTVTFTFTDSLAVTESFTSLSALAVNTWYMLDVWAVFKNSAGATLPQPQVVIRASTLSAGAQGTVTTLINVLTAGTTSPVQPLGGGSGAAQPFGEKTTRGAGFSFYLGNVYEAWEDADDPYGVIRVDRLDPTAGNSAKNNQWTTAALGANVDESGTAEPDDATTIDTVSVTNTTKDQTYGLTNTVIATGSGDKVIRTVAAIRTSESGTPPKGALTRIELLESDGTNNQLGAVKNSPVAAGSYASYYQGFDKNPAGGAWDTTSLNSLEMGERADTNSTNPITYNLSTVITLVAYQAAGETMPAVPGAPPKIPSLFVRQGVKRASLY